MGFSICMAAVWVVGLLLPATTVASVHRSSFRHAASPGYRPGQVCPTRCIDAGADSVDWPVYRSFDQIKRCPETMFYDFSLYDNVDDRNAPHRIFACTSYGPDWTSLPNSTLLPAQAEKIAVDYQIGWLDESPSPLDAASIRSVSKQMRRYLESGFGAANNSGIMFAHSGQVSVGLYIGAGLQREGVSSFALSALEGYVSSDLKASNIAMQLCGPGFDGTHVFGLMATTNRTFGPVQEAIKSWSNATCLSLTELETITGQAYITSPMVNASASNSFASNSSASNSTLYRSRELSEPRRLAARAECETIQVNAGNGCADLAERCGISGHEFTQYNSYDSTLCANLQPQQHVCCTPGDLPDFSPKPQPDGTCATHTIEAGDSCAALAAANSLEQEELENFNKNTWGWSGCNPLYRGTIICLSTGDPPMPAPIQGAQCGPQVPGTEKPTDGTDITDLNPCPLNACCDVWGFCGITAEFCTNTSTGAPGTAEPGTNGCISNCGTDIIKSDKPATFRKIGYFQGYNLNRDCVLQDGTQIDASAYTHLQFAFGLLTQDYQVNVGDLFSTYEFGVFKNIRGPKKILSFGGWAFSTEPETYSIFREGVKSANRLTLAQNIANFINDHDLDGVDIDWEYPGAPDIPGIPPGGEDDGENYLAFLVILKNLLSDKSVSIAAPSSFWYLKAYPIDEIAKIVDYIVFMTYDLHGQWDAGNPNSQADCPNGQCLRSQVNLTETMDALAMITKAGVPSNLLAAGVTGYGRSFNMMDGNCYSPDCFFTGTRLVSDAKRGPCTNEGGILANAEIHDILSDSSRVSQNFVDQGSHSNILVYDGNQYVSWMSSEVKAQRESLYAALSIGGSVNWATDLETRNDPPAPADSWLSFKQLIRDGKDPDAIGDRNGNWTELDCDSTAWDDRTNLSPSERWHQMDAPTAWSDLVTVWKENKDLYDTFSDCFTLNLDVSAALACESLEDTNNCDNFFECTNDRFGPDTGVAGIAILNSFVMIHEMYSTLYSAVSDAAASEINNALDDFANKFAPVPPEPDNTWLLVLLDIVTIGASAALGPFFNNFLSKLPRFLKDGSTTADNLKDTTILFVQQGTTLAKDLLETHPADWDEQSQDEFTNYIGKTIDGWLSVTADGLKRLFDGSDESIARLGAAIADGTFIGGSGSPGGHVPNMDGEAGITQLRHDVSRNFFALAIPEIWRLSGTHAFVIDSGYACDQKGQLGQYLDDDTMAATEVCEDGTLYYLAEPKGQATETKKECYQNSCMDVEVENKFSMPPGLDSLGDGSTFGGITIQDLIVGSVRSYVRNGENNDTPRPSTEDDDFINDLAFNKEVTSSGLIRLPVCSPERAFETWDTADADSSDFYPCNFPKGPDHCGESTFVNQGSDASPPVEDCKQIIKNIAGDADADWDVDLVTQHQLVEAGDCRFGVEATDNPDGNVQFFVGAQDIIDIINTSIEKFGGSGRVGAKGNMDCKGNVQVEQVEWGIY